MILIAGGANVASGGIGKGDAARSGAGATGAAAQVHILFFKCYSPMVCAHVQTIN